MPTITANGRFRKDRLPLAEDYYRTHEGFRLGKVNFRGWAIVMGDGCPVHRSKSKRSFSVNTRSGGFKCWGCSASGGDLIAYVMLRDGCDFKTAAQILGAWDGNVPSPQAAELRAASLQRERERDAQAVRRESGRRQRIEAREWLHFLYRPLSRLSRSAFRLAPAHGRSLRR